jgi:hypothetical protein
MSTSDDKSGGILKRAIQTVVEVGKQFPPVPPVAGDLLDQVRKVVEERLSPLRQEMNREIEERVGPLAQGIKREIEERLLGRIKVELRKQFRYQWLAILVGIGLAVVVAWIR